MELSEMERGLGVSLTEIQAMLDDGRVMCFGPVRGWCGHRHRSAKAVLKCLADDATGCNSQGGYSDRIPVPVED
jgi:hypothetical protein